jgi:membrane-anchored glycerophosphoryl diester phosphodiesterase (GDPDase)
MFVLNPFFWGSMIVSFLGYFALQGFVTRSSVLHMMGREPDHKESVLVALRLILPLIGIAIVTGFAVMVGIILLIVPGIMVYVALIVAVPALVEERRGVFGSIRRSRDLTRGSRWLIFLLAILFYVVAIVFSTLLNTIAGVSMFGPNLADPANLPNAALAGLAGAIAQSLTAVFTAVMVASLYVELRTVKEGASREVLAGIFE